MCLLMEIKKDCKFSDTFLHGVYQRNSDGLGIMWHEDGALHYYKCLPTNATEAAAIFREYTEGKDCFAHWRMKTHGDIDLTNCHPYPVFGFEGSAVDDHDLPMLMMHNGVLSTGNSKDFSKSDTWHYIRDFIAPLVSANPDILHTEAFQKIIAAHIGGSNKFAFMDALGRSVVINRQAGVTYEGAWLSNTYAWDYSTLHPNAPKPWTPQQSRYGSFDTPAWQNYLDQKYPYSKPVAPEPKKPKHKRAKGKQEKLPFGTIVQQLMDDLCFSAPDVHDSIMVSDMTHALRQTCKSDIEDLIELTSYGYITESDCLKAILDPDVMLETINNGMLAEAQVDLDIEESLQENLLK